MGGAFSRCFTVRPSRSQDRWLNRPNLKLGPGRDLRTGFHFHPHQALGRGRTAIVWGGVDLKTGEGVAVKRCSKKLLRGRQVVEIEIMIRLQTGGGCLRIPRLLATYEDEHRLFLVTQLCRGGDLYRHISQAPTFSEAQASAIVCQLLEALLYLHHKRVVHRDVKPGNVLFVAPGGSDLQLVDLGNACITSREFSSCQSHPPSLSFFSAPELFHRGGYHTLSSDIWSVGALLYVMLGGLPPPLMSSREVQGNSTWINLSMGQLEWVPDNTSEELVDFLRQLLHPIGNNRLTAAEALSHPWITGVVTLSRTPLTRCLKNITEYSNQRALYLSQTRVAYVAEKGGKPTMKRVPVGSRTGVSADDWGGKSGRRKSEPRRKRDKGLEMVPLGKGKWKEKEKQHVMIEVLGSNPSPHQKGWVGKEGVTKRNVSKLLKPTSGLVSRPPWRP